MFGSSGVRIPAGFDTTPGLTAAAARTIGEKHVLGAAKAIGGQPARLVVWADATSKAPTKATLAWEVQIDQRGSHVLHRLESHVIGRGVQKAL